MLNSSTEVIATRIRSAGDDNAPAPKTPATPNPSGGAMASAAGATTPVVATAATQNIDASAAKASTTVQAPQTTGATAPAVAASSAPVPQYDAKSPMAIAAWDNRPAKPVKAAATAAQADSKTQQPPSATTAATAPAAAVSAATPAITAPAVVPPPAPDTSQAVAARAYAPPAADANSVAGMPLPNLPSLAGPPPADASAANTQIARADVSDPAAGQAPVGDQAQLAQAELRKAQDRIGLSDAQVGQLQQAQDKLAAGDSGTAFLLLQELNMQLQTETRSYVVQENESLWHVAGQQEVYGNSYLWPLVWQANKHKVKQPYQLYKGLRLTIPAHPTLQEVSEALAYSKNNGGEGMRPATNPQAPAAAPASAPAAPAPAAASTPAPATPAAAPTAEPTSAAPAAAPSN